jgi:hypothetical protein
MLQPLSLAISQINGKQNYYQTTFMHLIHLTFKLFIGQTFLRVINQAIQANSLFYYVYSIITSSPLSQDK